MMLILGIAISFFGMFIGSICAWLLSEGTNKCGDFFDDFDFFGDF
jgi:hypothetical protein